MRVALLVLPTLLCGADPSSFQDVSSEASQERRNMRRVPEVIHRRLHMTGSSGPATNSRGTAMLVTLRSAVVKGGERLLKNAAGIQTSNEQKGMLPSWMWGALLTLVGSTLTSLGLVLQKYSHERNMRKESASVKYYLQKWWVAGFSIWIFAQVVNLAAMGLAPQTVLSCFGSWTIICNILIARVVLGERVGCAEVMAMVGLLFGSGLVLVGAPHEMAPHVSGDIHAIWDLLVCRHSLALTLTFGVTALALKAVLSGALYWVLSAAILTGFTALLFKCVSLMLVALPSGMPSPWVCPQAYVILVCATCCGVLEVHTLNLGLRLGKAVLLTPIYMSTGMLAQILTSGVLLNEFGQFASMQQAAAFCLGVGISMGFIMMLMSVKTSTDGHKS